MSRTVEFEYGGKKAVEQLKNVKKLGEFDVVVMDDLREKYPEKIQ